MKTMFLQRVVKFAENKGICNISANFLQHLKVNGNAALTIYLQNIPTFI